MSVNRKADYLVNLIGLGSDSVGDITIDRQVWLHQLHGTYGIALVPLGTSPQPSYHEALFWADCLSYDHDAPALVVPSTSAFRKQRYTFLLDKMGERTREWYFRDMLSAMEIARALRYGSLAFIEFRWDHLNLRANLPYTARYGKAEKDLHLYATALKQLDPLSEYLLLYRVLESVHGGNAKTWVENSLAKVRNFDFGVLAYGVEGGKGSGNVFSLHKRRALHRLATIRRVLSTNQEIAGYLYNEVRCGIAHGENIKKYDLGSDFFSIAKDLYILKLLARISIDEKIGSFAPVVVSQMEP